MPCGRAAALAAGVEAQHRRIDHQRARRVQVRVLHEAAADHVALIAEAGVDLAVRGQQQARVLEAAAGEHVGSGAHAEPLAGERRDLQPLHLAAGLVRRDVDHARVQQEQNVVGRLQLAAIDLAEQGRRAELPDPAHDLGGVERQRPPGRD